MPGIFNTELFDSRYHVYRTDRDYGKTKMTRGGGTLVAARREYRVDERDISAMVVLPDAEVTWIDIHFSRGSIVKKLRLFTCYFPHSINQKDSQHTFFELLSDIYTDFPDDLYVVVGDFNISEAT